ncbi:MAG: HigA family addiction module antidote protein [Lachnospiraceae bacterium]|nr:HigA family addiction module antidote protein [Lachnospiraceae bacterium]
MSDYIEYNDKIAFHPGYYIREIVEESGLTQEDFAKRLDTTPKNLSLLIRGEQSLSIDIAVKLSRMIGTSVIYWLNLQNSYDALIAEFKSEEELVNERKVFSYFDYRFFRDNYGLPDLPRQRDEQIKALRAFFKVSSLTVLRNRDLAVSFRSAADDLTEASTVKANAMVQIAINKAIKIDAPRFNKKNFEKVVEYALTLTKKHDEFYMLLRKAFLEAGVVFVILHNISGSQTNGATKKIGDNILLMVNDRRLNADSFWFTLFHEIGHIINGDYGISFEQDNGNREEAADKYAQDSLIPAEQYKEFIENGRFDIQSIREFADRIDRDPGIVLGRLQNDKKVDYDDWTLKPLRHKYTVRMGG